MGGTKQRGREAGGRDERRWERGGDGGISGRGQMRIGGRFEKESLLQKCNKNGLLKLV